MIVSSHLISDGIWETRTMGLGPCSDSVFVLVTLYTVFIKFDGRTIRVLKHMHHWRIQVSLQGGGGDKSPKCLA